jgi:hypothetical protein
LKDIQVQFGLCSLLKNPGQEFANILSCVFYVIKEGQYREVTAFFSFEFSLVFLDECVECLHFRRNIIIFLAGTHHQSRLRSAAQSGRPNMLLRNRIVCRRDTKSFSMQSPVSLCSWRISRNSEMCIYSVSIDPFGRHAHV